MKPTNNLSGMFSFYGGRTLSEESLKTYVEKRLPRAEDKELLWELMEVFKEGGKEGLRKHLQNMVSQLEEG
jgi:hypothetical protein